MTMRQIKQRPGSSKLGTMANQASSTKHQELIEIIVYDDITSRQSRAVGIQFKGVAGGKVFSLSPNVAVELAKGLLQNLPDVYLAADDELQAILKEKVAAADRDARAAVEAVRERLTQTPSATSEVPDQTKIDTTGQVAYPVDLAAVPQAKKRRKS